jgi:hypothetical protein
MKYPQIHKARAIDDTTLAIELTNGEVKKYDIRHLLETPMFSGLRQAAFFRNFQGSLSKPLCTLKPHLD